MVAPGGAPQPTGKPGGAPGQPGNPPNGAPANPGEAGAAKPADGAKSPEAPKTTTRPEKPPTPANPDELKLRPDADGMVRFNFHGQPWLGVLEWLAAISELSLDWQEVPADFLNLRTQRKYTVDEARDLINRHLLDRGFTLIRHGEVLTVVNIKKLDPSTLPRVRPNDLEQREPHEFVKVSFPLDWMVAETAVEELKPMLSPNGKLTALKSTNRIEAIDAVANLRDIRDVLNDEQSNKGRKRLVREFKLEYVRAQEVLEHLQGLLGLEKAAAPQTPEQMQMQMQQQMMRQQQQQQQGQQPGAQKPKPEIHLVVNQRENSVVAHAPTDQMAIIAEAVSVLDVPNDRSQSLLQNANRMQVYRMSTIDPEVLTKMLNELGELDPNTRLTVDKRNRAVIAHASLADHLTIRMLVGRLDGSDRKFEVIRLRRLEADYVAGTIEFMMGGANKDKQQNNRFSPFYYDFMPFGRQNNQEDESKKFRVDADVENNRLLLFANPVELAEVENLLVKLGEMPSAGGNPATLRVLDTIDPDEADELLRRLQKTWPGIAPNPLQFGPGSEPRERPEPAAEQDSPRKPPNRKPALPEKTTDIEKGSPRAAAPVEELKLLRLVQFKEEKETSSPAPASSAAENEKGALEPAEEPVDTNPLESEPVVAIPDATKNPDTPTDGGAGFVEPGTPGAAPGIARSRNQAPSPIRIGRGPDGRLFISSEDPAALDQLEDLVSQIAPPRRDYKVFRMKNKSTWAYGVAENLKEFFDEKDKDKNKSYYDPFWGGFRRGGGQQTEDTGRKLSKRRPLKFIVDIDSNSILVTGADPAQLKIIQDLIDLYDVAESKDPQAARITKTYLVRYSKSRVIADALKEVYRDLLSVNDPAMQQQQGNQKNQRPAEPTYTYIYNTGAEGEKRPDTPLKFKGALSIGVDELSNTLIISAGEGLLTNVEATIKELDNAARPTVPRMQVMRIDRNVDVSDLQKRLTKLTTKPQQPQQPGQKQPQQPGQPEQPAQPNGGTQVIEN